MFDSSGDGRQQTRWVGRVNFQKLDQQTALPKELTASHPKGSFADDFTFPKVGFVGSVEGVDIKETNTRSCDGFFVGILNAGAAITIFVYTLTTAITPLFNVWRLGPTDRCWENHTISNWGFFKMWIQEFFQNTTPPIFFIFGFFRFLSVHLMVVNEGRFSVDFMWQRWFSARLAGSLLLNPNLPDHFFLAALECPKKLHKTFTFQMERLETEKHPANLVREGWKTME